MTSHHPVLTRLAGRPLALAPRAIDALLAVGRTLDARSTIPLASVGDRHATHGFTLTDSFIAVVPVVGPLVSRGDWLSALFGATDYGTLGGTIGAAFAEPSARAVLLELDSPGGEVGGLLDLVERLTALRAESGKPLWAVASESALSAGFAIASAADRLYLSRTAEVGSVGIVAVHVDESGADAMAGHAWTLIHAGRKKVEGNPHSPLSTEAVADIQADVDALHDELVALVARNRGLSPDAVRATEAAVYRGRRGIDAGFADQLGSLDQALADLTAMLDRPAPKPAATATASRTLVLQPSRRTPSMTSETDTIVEDAVPAEPEAPATEPSDTAEGKPASTAPPVAPVQPAAPEPSPGDTAERLRAEYAEIAAVAAQAGRLGIAIDAADAMARGLKPEALRRSVLDALSQRAEASAVVAAAPPAPTAGDSPIVRRARERAATANAKA
jgi:ClpP class serine protease